ncbi:MAG: type I asparaginase [Neptuniibacter sp.]
MINKRILIIYTGGTIGMVSTDNGFVPIAGFRSTIEERIHFPPSAKIPEYDVLEITPAIDSANLVPAHWTDMASAIIEHYEKYDGFIVLHGTDTMAYSASALSFILRGVDKPVILTGSQIPLSEPRSDAQDNLSNALIIAAYHPANEVMIFFHGKLLRGNRATKSKATGLDAFESPNYPWIGQVGPNIEIHEQLLLPETKQEFVNPEFSNTSVAILPIYPGIPAKIAVAICKTEELQGLIVKSYGVGNLPNQNTSLMNALKQVANNGCVILNISQCLQAEVFQGHYASSAELNDIGVISGSNMTTEAAFSKLHFLLASEKEQTQVKEKLYLNLVGELDN